MAVQPLSKTQECFKHLDRGALGAFIGIAALACLIINKGSCAPNYGWSIVGTSGAIILVKAANCFKSDGAFLDTAMAATFLALAVLTNLGKVSSDILGKTILGVGFAALGLRLCGSCCTCLKKLGEEENLKKTAEQEETRKMIEAMRVFMDERTASGNTEPVKDEEFASWYEGYKLKQAKQNAIIVD